MAMEDTVGRNVDLPLVTDGIGDLGTAATPEIHIEYEYRTVSSTRPEAKSAPVAESAAEPATEPVAAAAPLDTESFVAGAVVPTTINEAERTVDVIWYGGATVPRIDRSTGDQYMLRLDMKGARLDRLNAGAAVFDSHMTGMDFPSAMNGSLGMKAQIGVVLKAWTEKAKGLATLKFNTSADPQQDLVWPMITNGTARNLSFGTWIYNMKQESGGDNADADSKPKLFVATDWEPFEISVVSIPADYGTEFLSAAPPATPAAPAATANDFAAQPPADPPVQPAPAPAPAVVPAAPSAVRATRPQEGQTMADEHVTAGAGNEARTAPDTQAAVEAALAAKRQRDKTIRTMASRFPSLDQKFVDGLIDSELTAEQAGMKMLDKIAEQHAAETPITGNSTVVTRDETDTRRSAMEAAILYRINPQKNPLKNGLGAEYRGLTLVDMARECLQVCGVRHRGLERGEIARVALQGRHFGAEQYFVGAQGTSDFPDILANVAGKSVRQAYELAPRTFTIFSRRVTAADFRTQTSVQLSDVPIMTKVNEHGEFQQANLSDSKETWALSTYGQIINITRQAVVNDDLQVLDRIPAAVGAGAAGLENSIAWGIITANAVMHDGVAIFAAGHANLETGGDSALAATGLANARKALRIQTGPKGNTLNLVPTFIIVPAALEHTMLQLLNPTQLAATAVTSVIPQWIMNLTPVVEPLLDANSTAYWYLFADPARIDTLIYAYLEGNEGVYIETKQGFEVDGVQLKGRLDFGAAMLDHRGAVRSNGA